MSPWTSPRAVAALVVAAFLAATAHASPAADTNAEFRPKALEGVGVEQRLGSTIPLDLQFTDTSGRAVTLHDYFDGNRPVILTLNYSRCPMLCPLELSGLVSALRTLSVTAGKEFQVVTVSIDPADTPATVSVLRDNALRTYSRLGAEAGWHVLTGKDDAIRALTESLGFQYTWDAESSQFAHAAAIYVLTPKGVLSRMLFGVEYAPVDVRLALVESSEGKIGTLVDHALLLFCYHYDPSDGRYGVTAMRVMRLGGLITVAGLAVLFVGLKRRAHVV